MNPALVDTPFALLGHTAVAAVLGIAFGVSLLFASRSSFRSITPDTLEAGMAFAAIALVVRMTLSGVALYLYYRFAYDGFVPFALGLAGGFVLLYMIELLKYGKMLSR